MAIDKKDLMPFIRAINDGVRQACKKFDIKADDKDITTALEQLVNMYASNNKEYVKVDASYIQDEDATREFAELHNSFVRQTIDFINARPKLAEHLENAKKELSDISKDNKFFKSDISISFGADCLEESIKNGAWHPSTDSYLGIYINDKPILVSC